MATSSISWRPFAKAWVARLPAKARSGRRSGKKPRDDERHRRSASNHHASIRSAAERGWATSASIRAAAVFALGLPPAVERIGSAEAEKRLARLLLLLANFGKEGRTEPILAKISQETLAEMIGTTRSRVSHFMNKFRKMGFIDYNGHLAVHKSLVGVLLADQARTVIQPKVN